MTFHLGVALDGYGWHTHAWQLSADTRSVLSGHYWADLARTAERGLLDFLTIDDTLMPQIGRSSRIHPDRLAGRGDAVLVAARIAPVTQHIGLIPVATVTHTEPFHVSKAIATLDHVSHGRAGWQPRVSGTAHEAALFGRRSVDSAALFDEGVEFVDVVRRLWDSWEDDAVIRDVATGRYVDRDKLHYIDFTGKYFSVKGPSITPRPPQGQPVVVALAHATPVYHFAAATSDVIFVTPSDEAAAVGILDEVRGISGSLKVFADIVVSFHGQDDFRSDTWVWAGTPAELVDMLLGWQRAGYHGARLRPSVNATDLPVIAEQVVPLLQRAKQFRTAYRDSETLRERLGLPVAPNRYVAVNR
ncbi:LLM class flavin-dependent oxidoreductase [Mycobacterium asiaticum]|uniref:FMNH2-dependent monooxygenase n=1 Tax=Mycobacterium asiaticum TaxID=1790 RepID=A0A1A3N6C2_MYCAS|nr:LLM class flavin-dependent oxidoreductase [Mycobacterium asiaticum]OBK17708.1 FMNH2-dependent monooxygenase [Mycobacterium asiaticum]